jgi:hypothetical protein
MDRGGECERLVELLTKRQPMPPLLPDRVHRPELAAAIDSLPAGPGVRAGLHLLNDDLERCHAYAQDREGTGTFDYWHAILHRREGDFGNSKYWFARVSSHPVLEAMHGPDLAGALAFVDQCAKVARTPSATSEREGLERRQLEEMILLLEYADQHGQ